MEVSGFHIPKFAPLPKYQQLASLHGGHQCAICSGERHDGGYTFCLHYRVLHHTDQIMVADAMKRLTKEKNRRRSQQAPYWEKKGKKANHRAQKKQQRHHTHHQNNQASIGLALAREQRQFAEAVGDAVVNLGNTPGSQQRNQQRKKQRQRKRK